MAARKKKPKLLACRNCGTTTKTDRETLSGFVHSHPEVCPYRRDKVPAMNGVHVGDHWRNLHTGIIVRVIECRLGGTGTYTDREPVYVTADVWKPERDEGKLDFGAAEPTLTELEESDAFADCWDWVSPTTMWSLSEHYEPVTRPDEYPVPWELRTDDRGHESRWAAEPWRTGGLHNPSGVEDDDGPMDTEAVEDAYYHAFHTRDSRWSMDWWQGWLVEAEVEAELPEAVEAELADELRKIAAAAQPAPPRAQEAEQLELAIG